MAKLAQLLFITLLFTLWINQVTCVDDENLEEKFNNMMIMFTGINYIHRIHQTTVNQELFNKMIHDVIFDLKCSYAYSSLHYIRLTRCTIQFNNKYVFNWIKNCPQFCFVDIIKSMLVTMRNCNQLTDVDFLWWFYMYVEHFDTIIKHSYTIFNQQIDFMLHNTVEKNILEFIDHNKCDSNNTYNVEDEHINVYKKVPETSSDWNDFLPEISEKISDLKLLLQTQFQQNQKFAEYSSLHSLFEYNQLSMNIVLYKDDVLKCLLNDFGELENSNIIFKYIKDDYKTLSKRTGLIKHRFILLGQMQLKIISLLKIIMLQIILRHMNYIKEYLESETTGICAIFKMFCIQSVLNNVNTRLWYQISNFFTLTSLREDPHYKKIIADFETNNFKNKDNIDDIVVSILKIIEELSTNIYSCQLSYPKQIDCSYVNNSILNKKLISNQLSKSCDVDDVHSSFKESILSAYVFVNYVRQKFKFIDFNIILSFLKFSKNLTV
ncbi:uncharacterized protein LOC126901898 [Daktulosphaira vitifoliae]|uniref:uncharacterized protein LOC126901898 n=1 Tax=Daktulosphaira vitifoliae TaxID=58002 RepID=UPI0021AACD44|nr:uncharacterized protein LOC126901898 [Daktulosphaira vitifoliae]XP_050534774.1 uncharacterized protein LOC126901898 [Daktulosphaira vitifoliae]